AELRVLPLALIVLLIAFGSATAGATPVAIGFLTVALARGLLALIDGLIPLSILAANVTTMLGLALSVDYALLVVSRFRDELTHADRRTAARMAAQHAGGAVLLSGAGVAIALAALLLAPINEVRSIGIAGLVVVAAAVAICTTLLPALLAIAGSRIDLLWPLRRRLAPAAHSLWNRWARVVFARPLALAICAAAPLLALALNCARLDISLPRGEWLPRSTQGAEAMAALNRIERTGLLQAIHVVARFDAPIAAPSSWRDLGQLAQRHASDPRVAAVRSIASVTGAQNAALYPFLPDSVRRMFVSHDRRTALIAVIPRSGLELHEYTQLARDLRAASAPAGVVAIDIGGAPALTADYIDAVSRWFAPIAGAILAATFIVLAIGLRSVLLPLKAVALNLLSVGAALGAMVLVFQDGHGAQWLGLQGPAHAVFPIVPILVFSVVFGLSMDYEVFLFSRVVEAHRAGQNDIRAMTVGLRATAGVITSAAVLMAIVFGAFVLGEFLLMKMLGFSLAVAILIDAVLVRLVLGPALFAIAGRWNWWPYRRAVAAGAAAVKQ
ncbi:MAG: MMPL family transporter, partial [Vitreimonas sp.]